ncbi:uncharacterized protein LOC122074287 [Macadamia integrifolia]|uniref:uncharacterized protein LOC122074287 n=1 Tax=Macadamia integrifolia TaxID=60698 RepID=UPI001C4F559C|nr:uncharacterized protein LOC122074287 [Macadamia integrifolia]
MEAESMDHIFLQCSFAEELWLFFSGCFNVVWKKLDSMADFLQWWKRKLKIVCCKEVWALGLITVADHIWRERNNRRHEGKVRPINFIKQMILEDIKSSKPSTKGDVKIAVDVICCRKLGLLIQNKPTLPILEVYWRRPQVNWIKLNFDGSSMGNPGRAGASGIFRNHMGAVMDSYKIFIGVSKVFQAEVEGLMVGLMRAREMGITRLWVETDSSAVAISFEKKKTHGDGSIWCPLSFEALLCARRLGISRIQYKPKEIIEVFWCPPPPGWVMLNSNGCSLVNPGKAGAGGILRNVMAERWMSLALYLQSLTWKITHCLREANPVVDFLAKSAAKFEVSTPIVSGQR